MRLVGYIRVSSRSQEDNTSLAEQERKIRAYCDAFGHELVGIYSEIESGKSAKARPQFAAAVAALTNADGLIATKLDRIARNCRDVLTLVDDSLQPQNKALVLLDLNVDTSTPTGKMILTVMAATAELERNTINERTQGGRKAKAAAGGFAYGSPKFGETVKDGQITQDNNEQVIIDIIRRHHKSGKSQRAIAEYLNKQGYKSKQGKQWSSTTVGRVLSRLYPARSAASKS